MESRPDETTIPLTVVNQRFLPAEHWPMSVGVPFPQGELRSPEDVHLTDPKGRPARCQTRALVPWPDGTVKWNLITFQADLGPNERAIYTLHRGRGPEVPGGIVISKGAGSIKVDTGPLQVKIPTRRFALFDQVAMGRKTVIDPRCTCDILTADDSGTEYRASQFSSWSFRITERGPVRAIIEAVGKHAAEDGRTFLDARLWWYFFADSPLVEVWYQFINREEPEEGVDVRQIRMDLQTALGPGALRTIRHNLHGRFTFTRYVEIPGQVRIGPGRLINFECLGERLDEYPHYLRDKLNSVEPYIDLSNGECGVTVGMWLMARHAPKELASEEDRVSIFVYPPSEKLLRLQQGMAKTHVALFRFHDCPADMMERETPLQLREVRPTISVPFDWIQRSRANELDQVMPYQPRKYLFLERKLRSVCTAPTGSGMLDVGDDYRQPNTRQWQNNEEDPMHGLMIMYWRTGNYRYFEDAELCVQHTIDVDMIHHSDDPLRQDSLVAHAVDHTNGSSYPSHMWTEGLLDYYCATGRPEVLEAAVGIGENLIRWNELGWEVVVATGREAGWSLVALMACYEHTLDERFLEGSRPLVEHYRTIVRERGGIVYPFPPKTPVWCGVFGNYAGYEGMWKFYRLTGEEDVGRFLLQCVDDEIERWLPDDLVFEFRGVATTIFYYGYMLTGDEKYLELGMPSLRMFLKARDTRRWLSYAGRHIRHNIQFLKLADERGLIDDSLAEWF